MISQSKAYLNIITVSLTTVLVFAITLFISQTHPFRLLELATLDQLFEMRGEQEVEDSDVVLVAMSQQADSQIPERWPWSRDVYAHLIENLNDAGAKVIGIDVVFDQPDPRAPRYDSLMAEAMAEHENVVLGGNLARDANQIIRVEPYRLFMDYNPNPYGLVTVDTDVDGTIRNYRLSRTHMDSTYHTFGLELIRQYKGWDESVELQREGEHYRFGDYVIPVESENNMKINFRGGPGKFLEFPLDNIIDDADYLTVDDREIWGYESVEEKQMGIFDDPEMGLLYTDDLEDKIVIVGSTMAELHDFHSTPFAPGDAMPGYEIHANAVETILNENYIRTADFGLNLLILFITSVLTALVTVYTSPFRGLWVIILMIAGIGFGVWYLFISMAYSVEIVAPIMAVVLGYVGTQTYNYFRTYQEKSRVQNMFGSYVSPALVDKMVDSEEEPQLGGEEKYITAFFSDIQSFSAFSEKLEPAELVELINEYLTGMTDILTEEKGTLDKYIGDAIVAFFGAPVPVEDHAYRACITSQRMLYKQAELREKWAKEGDKWPDIVSQMQTRIGINTGRMLTGNLGSATRFNYTMMGDNVNLAARCESGAKAYGAYCMVTEETKNEAEKVGDECVFRFLDKIIVVGRTQPVDVYEILGLKAYLDSDHYSCLNLYNQGINFYLNQEWDEAVEAFSESAKYEIYQPGRDYGVKTNPSLVMIERCKEMKEAPPGEDWDGVYEMKSK